MRNFRVSFVFALALAAGCGVRPHDREEAGGGGEESVRRFLIGSSCLRSEAFCEEMVLAMKEAGLDFFRGIPSPTPERFAICAKHDLKLFASPLPRVVAQWGTARLKKNLLADYVVKAGEFKGAFGENPQPVFCINLGDEPFARDLPDLQEAVWCARRLFPKMWFCLNLNPVYGMKEAFGEGNYEDYIDAYCRLIPLDHLCYDFYLYAPVEADNPDLLRLDYINKVIVANACRRTGRAFWYYAQANSYPGKGLTSENKMRYQALSAMAFGVEVLQWACWQDGAGWWSNNVYTAVGQRTEQFGKLKRVNAELHRIGEDYMRFRNTATHFVGFEGRPEVRPTKSLRTRPPASVERLTVGSIAGLCAEDGSPLLVGEMVARRRGDGSRALFVFSADDPWDKGAVARRLRFETAGEIRVLGLHGEVAVRDDGKNRRSVPISSNEAVLMIVGGEPPEDDGQRFRVVSRHEIGCGAERPLSTGYFSDVHAEDGCRIEVSEMVPRHALSGPRALLIKAPAVSSAGGGADARARRILFRSGGIVREMRGGAELPLAKDAKGWYAVHVAPGEARTVLEVSDSGLTGLR